MKTVNIYTDGACSGNQNEENSGGWGCVLEYCGFEKEFSGGELDTTNNRMELMALISALSALREKGLCLRIFSDSSYLVNCFKNKWYAGWQKNGWKTSSKKPVENRELWEKLLYLLEGQSPCFFLIKGHLKNPGEAEYERFCSNNGGDVSFEEFLAVSGFNARCDALATAAAERAKALRGPQ